MNVLLVFGTRPEAIKMVPVAKALAASPRCQVTICVTAQHRGMLDQVLDLFSVTPDIDFDLMKPGQDLSDITTRVLLSMRDLLASKPFDLVLVHGDTTTSFAAGLAAFYAGIPVGHVEAGLRTGDLSAPFPEEYNRKATAIVTALHFAPTERSRQNLLAEGYDDSTIHVTGNTVIDALLETADRLEKDETLAAGCFEKVPTSSEKRTILVTGHRRENFGHGFEQICDGLARLAERDDVEIIYPVHPNPKVLEAVHRRLGGRDNVRLIEPLDYLPFVDLMRRSHIILTDSGGIQEEAPSLSKPVLVMRDVTERPEAVEAGTVKLVGTDSDRLYQTATRLLDDDDHYAAMAYAHNPYGDGKAAERIVTLIEQWWERR